MGNCRSCLLPANPPSLSTPTKDNVADGAPPTTSMDESSSTSALIQAILPVILPIARQVISQQFISQKMVLFQEELVEDMDMLPMGPMDLTLEHIHVLTPESLEKDIQKMPEFEWPEAKRYKSLMMKKKNYVNSSAESEEFMVAVDITGVALTVRLAPGMELAVQVDGPMGIKANLEVGTGGTISEATLRVKIPKLRVWFVNTDQRYKVYIAFMARPKIVPQVHINVDRGHGDFLEMEMNGGGGLDDMIESILCGFGPSRLTHDAEHQANYGSTEDPTTTTNNSTPDKRSWIADALGRQISKAMETFAGVGKNRPLELDLHDTIQEGINAALGKKKRSVEEIEAEIEQLQKELEKAKQDQERNKTGMRSAHQQEEKKQDESSSTGRAANEVDDGGTTRANASEVAPSYSFCGIGA